MPTLNATGLGLILKDSSVIGVFTVITRGVDSTVPMEAKTSEEPLCSAFSVPFASIESISVFATLHETEDETS